MNYQVKTIADAEARISAGLNRLRSLARLDEDATFAISILAPAKRRTVVQLEEDGRKKRNTAGIANWNHDKGEVRIYFEPEDDNAEVEASNSEPQLDPEHSVSLAPAKSLTTEEELKQCCLSLADAEKAGKPFLALKWFRDTYLAGQAYTWASTPLDRGRVLNHAIHTGLIDTQSLTNPKNPTHPTTTLRLNRIHAKHLVGSRFNPIPLRGEPLSSMIIRDRG